MTVEAPEQVAMETIKGWLETISAANGFHSDCAGRVFFDRPADRDTQLPFIILDDADAGIEGKVINLNFYVIGVLPLSTDNDEKRAGRRFLWDVRQCLRRKPQAEISGFKVSFLGQSLDEPEDQSAILIPSLHCVATFPDNEIEARY